MTGDRDRAPVGVTPRPLSPGGGRRGVPGRHALIVIGLTVAACVAAGGLLLTGWLGGPPSATPTTIAGHSGSPTPAGSPPLSLGSFGDVVTIRADGPDLLVASTGTSAAIDIPHAFDRLDAQGVPASGVPPRLGGTEAGLGFLAVPVGHGTASAVTAILVYDLGTPTAAPVQLTVPDRTNALAWGPGGWLVFGSDPRCACGGTFQLVQFPSGQRQTLVLPPDVELRGLMWAADGTGIVGFDGSGALGLIGLDGTFRAEPHVTPYETSGLERPAGADGSVIDTTCGPGGSDPGCGPGPGPVDGAPSAVWIPVGPATGGTSGDVMWDSVGRGLWHTAGPASRPVLEHFIGPRQQDRPACVLPLAGPVTFAGATVDDRTLLLAGTSGTAPGLVAVHPTTSGCDVASVTAASAFVGFARARSTASGGPTPSPSATPPALAVDPAAVVDSASSGGDPAAAEAIVGRRVFGLDGHGSYAVDLVCVGPGTIVWQAQANQTPAVVSATHPCDGQQYHDASLDDLAGPWDVTVEADGSAAWAIAVTTAGGAPTPTPEPTPTPGPTAACPPPEPLAGAPQVPSVILISGKKALVGEPWSSSVIGCGFSGTSDGVPDVPAHGVVVSPGATFSLATDEGDTIFEVSAHYDVATPGANPSAGHILTVGPGSAPGTFTVAAPPVGDWVVEIDIAINDTRHGAVWHLAVDFRVTG